MYTIVTWEELKNRINQEFNVKFHSIDDLMLLNTKWFSVDIYKTPDQKILKKLEQLVGFEGELYIVTEVSYMISDRDNNSGGAFKVKSEHLNLFCKEYAIKYNQPVFNLEAFIISFELKICWLVHHEGIYGVINYREYQEPRE